MEQNWLSVLNAIMKTEFVGTLVATAVASGFGAWAAFRFEASARERRDLDAIVVAGSQAITTLKRYYAVLIKYGQSRGETRLLGEIQVNVSDTRLDQVALGFVFKWGRPELMTELLDAEDRCLVVIADIRRFTEVRPGGRDVGHETTHEFNSLQPAILERLVAALPEVTAAIRRLHWAMEHNLPKRYKKRLVSIDDIGPEAEARNKERLAKLTEQLQPWSAVAAPTDDEEPAS